MATKITNKRLPELGVDGVIFYYSGRNTVCLLIKDGKALARGVAVCSPSDQFVKTTGRNKALGRAVKAAIHTINSEPVKGLAFFKATYRPFLLANELKLIALSRK